MSIQVSNNLSRPGNDCFDRCPGDVVRLIFSYLQEENKEVIASARTCKQWKNNPILQKEREKAANRLYLQKSVLREMLALQKDYRDSRQFFFDQIRMSQIGARIVVLNFDKHIYTPSQLARMKEKNKQLKKFNIALVIIGAVGWFLHYYTASEKI